MDVFFELFLFSGNGLAHYTIIYAWSECPQRHLGGHKEYGMGFQSIRTRHLSQSAQNFCPDSSYSKYFVLSFQLYIWRTFFH